VSEVHLPGRGWQTVDATPGAAGGDGARQTPLLRALADLLALAWARATGAVGGGLPALGAAAGLLAAGWLARRIVRRRRAGRLAARALAEERPPPELEELLSELSRRRLSRPASEPLERFAERLRQEGAAEAAGLLDRYAAHRYGGAGDGREILQALAACAARVRRGG
jgi:hypothetical protein